jgi:hypothetical protein
MRALKAADHHGWMGASVKAIDSHLPDVSKIRPSLLVEIHANARDLFAAFAQMESEVQKKLHLLESQLKSNSDIFKFVIDDFAKKMRVLEADNRSLSAKLKAASSSEDGNAAQLALLQRENEALQSALLQERQVRVRSEKLMLEKQRMEYCDLVLDHSASLRSEQLRYDAQLREMAAKHEAETRELTSKVSTLEASLSLYTASANNGKSLLQETQEKNKQLEDKLAASKKVILDQKAEVERLRAEVAMEVTRREQPVARHLMEQKHKEEIADAKVARLKGDLASMEADYKSEKGQRASLEAIQKRPASSIHTESHEVSEMRSKLQELEARVLEETQRSDRLSATIAEVEKLSAQKLEEVNQLLNDEKDRCSHLVSERSELMHNMERLRANCETDIQVLHSTSTRQHSSALDGELAELREANARLSSSLEAAYAEIELRNQDLVRLDALLGAMDRSLLLRFPNASLPSDEGLILRTSLDGVFYVKDLSNLSVNMRALLPADETQGGFTGWYHLDDLYYYFCRVNDSLVLLGGPITPQDFNELRSMYPCHISPGVDGGFYAVDKSFLCATEISRYNVQHELIRLSERITYLESELSDVMKLPHQLAEALDHIQVDDLDGPDPTPRHGGDLKGSDADRIVQGNRIVTPREHPILHNNASIAQPNSSRDTPVISTSIPDVVYVAQNHLPFAINAKAITAHTRILVPVLGEKAGGSSGWYILQGQYYYFCRVDNELVLQCGPLVASEYSTVLQQSSEEAGTEPKLGLIHLSALYANKIVINELKASLDREKLTHSNVDNVTGSNGVDLDDESPRLKDGIHDPVPTNKNVKFEGSESSSTAKETMNNTVTAVIIKMLRKEIQYLKKIALQDSQTIAALKGKSLMDNEDNIHAGPSRQVSVTSLLTDDSPDDSLPLSARKASGTRHVLKSEGSRVAVDPLPSGDKSAPDTSTPKLSNQVEVAEHIVEELKEIGNNLRMEIQYLRGLLLEDCLLISALKAKLGISDDEEIEIPGYTGVNVLSTDRKDSQYMPAKIQDNITVNLVMNEDHSNVELKPVVQLQHKVHILKNLLVQQGGEVRSLLLQIDELQKGGRISGAGALSADSLNSSQNKSRNPPGKATDDMIARALSPTAPPSSSAAPRSELANALSSLWAAHAEIIVLKRRLSMFESAKQTADYVAASGIVSGSPSVDFYPETQKLIKIQALIRGFLTRAKIKYFKKYLAAKSSGVLFAMKHTKQGNYACFKFYLLMNTISHGVHLAGESGWYAGPDGSLFYFILDNVCENYYVYLPKVGFDSNMAFSRLFSNRILGYWCAAPLIPSATRK